MMKLIELRSFENRKTFRCIRMNFAFYKFATRMFDINISQNKLSQLLECQSLSIKTASAFVTIHIVTIHVVTIIIISSCFLQMDANFLGEDGKGVPKMIWVNEGLKLAAA